MIVLKSTYNELFELFCQEKHGALELYKETKELSRMIHERNSEIANLRWEILRLKGVV